MAPLSDLMGRVRELGSERLRFLGVVVGGHFAIHWFSQMYPVVLPTLKASLGLTNAQVGFPGLCQAPDPQHAEFSLGDASRRVQPAPEDDHGCGLALHGFGLPPVR